MMSSIDVLVVPDEENFSNERLSRMLSQLNEEEVSDHTKSNDSEEDSILLSNTTKQSSTQITTVDEDSSILHQSTLSLSPIQKPDPSSHIDLHSISFSLAEQESLQPDESILTEDGSVLYHPDASFESARVDLSLMDALDEAEPEEHPQRATIIDTNNNYENEVRYSIAMKKQAIDVMTANILSKRPNISSTLMSRQVDSLLPSTNLENNEISFEKSFEFENQPNMSELDVECMNLLYDDHDRYSVNEYKYYIKQLLNESLEKTNTIEALNQSLNDLSLQLDMQEQKYMNSKEKIKELKEENSKLYSDIRQLKLRDDANQINELDEYIIKTESDIYMLNYALEIRNKELVYLKENIEIPKEICLYLSKLEKNINEYLKQYSFTDNENLSILENNEAFSSLLVDQKTILKKQSPSIVDNNSSIINLSTDEEDNEKSNHQSSHDSSKSISIEQEKEYLSQIEQLKKDQVLLQEYHKEELRLREQDAVYYNDQFNILSDIIKKVSQYIYECYNRIKGIQTDLITFDDQDASTVLPKTIELYKAIINHSCFMNHSVTIPEEEEESHETLRDSLLDESEAMNLYNRYTMLQENIPNSANERQNIRQSIMNLRQSIVVSKARKSIQPISYM